MLLKDLITTTYTKTKNDDIEEGEISQSTLIKIHPKKHKKHHTLKRTHEDMILSMSSSSSDDDDDNEENYKYNSNKKMKLYNEEKIITLAQNINKNPSSIENQHKTHTSAQENNTKISEVSINKKDAKHKRKNKKTRKNNPFKVEIVGISHTYPIGKYPCKFYIAFGKCEETYCLFLHRPFDQEYSLRIFIRENKQFFDEVFSKRNFLAIVPKILGILYELNNQPYIPPPNPPIFRPSPPNYCPYYTRNSFIPQIYKYAIDYNNQFNPQISFDNPIVNYFPLDQDQGLNNNTNQIANNGSNMPFLNGCLNFGDNELYKNTNNGVSSSSLNPINEKSQTIFPNDFPFKGANSGIFDLNQANKYNQETYQVIQNNNMNYISSDLISAQNPIEHHNNSIKCNDNKKPPNDNLRNIIKLLENKTINSKLDLFKKLQGPTKTLSMNKSNINNDYNKGNKTNLSFLNSQANKNEQKSESIMTKTEKIIKDIKKALPHPEADIKSLLNLYFKISKNLELNTTSIADDNTSNNRIKQGI